jgi:magnesium transporter
MKVLTVIATIFLPLTFIAGVYGMNFSGGPYNMPELTWRYGYPAVWLLMIVVAAGMLVYFRRREYL